jgi:hypothetical protein
MKELIVTVKPFIFEQSVYLFEDGVLKMQVNAPMDDLAERTLAVAMFDEVETVVIKGNVDFSAKIKEEIRQKELAQYGMKKLTIHLQP